MADTKISALPNGQDINAASGSITLNSCNIGTTKSGTAIFSKVTVDNLVIDGNDISSGSGDVTITPASGNQIVLDGTIEIDAGVVTGATSITSTAFAGALTGNVTGNVTGNLTGNVTGNVSGSAATVTQASQSAITSLGTLTELQVDNLNINGNTISATTGAVNITPFAGSAIVLDGTINVDAGVVTGATSITSTAFAGTLTGNVTGNADTATKLATARAIYGNNFDGSAALTQVIASTYGGTGNGFAKISGPASTEKTFTLPNASANILTDNAAVTVAQGGTGATTLTSNNVILGNGTSAVQFVAPGTSTNVLTSNGTTWTSAAAPGDVTVANNGYASNLYYTGFVGFTGGGSVTHSADTLYSFPFYVGDNETFTRIGVNVDTTGTATTARLGIYNLADGIPTSLVLDAGTVTISTTGDKEATISQALTKGIYAMAFVMNGTANMTQVSLGSGPVNHVFGANDIATLNRSATGTHSFGALPGTYPAVTYSTSGPPLVWLRKV